MSETRLRSRIDLRTRPTDKSLFLRAAELSGMSLSQFMTHAALKVAREVINEEERIVLSERAWEKFLDLLDNPPSPNPRLKAALEHYEREIGDD